MCYEPAPQSGCGRNITVSVVTRALATKVTLPTSIAFAVQTRNLRGSVTLANAPSLTLRALIDLFYLQHFIRAPTVREGAKNTRKIMKESDTLLTICDLQRDTSELTVQG